MIWIVGAKGMLGQEMVKALEAAGKKVTATDREVDFTDLTTLEDFTRRTFSAAEPLEWIVNCAAYTAVDKAEEDRDLCRKLNVEGPRNLGKTAKRLGARVLHISTDYVFDGKGIEGPDGSLRAYREEDPVGPQGYYGLTKAEGETALLEAAPDSIVVRTAWLYGAGGPNFVFTMLRLMKSKESIGVVADQWGTPTWAADLAAAAAEMTENALFPQGIYHFSGEGVTNWHEFALEIQKLGHRYGLLEKPCAVNALTTDQYPTKTVRPAWSVLDKTKIKSQLRYPLKDWKVNLEEFFQLHFQRYREAQQLYRMSEYDLDTSKAMLDSGRYLYVVYTMQQAIEKALKALITFHTSVPRIHNLSELSGLARISLSDCQKDTLETLTFYLLKGRYPSDLQKMTSQLTRDKATELFQEGETLCRMIWKSSLLTIV